MSDVIGHSLHFRFCCFTGPNTVLPAQLRAIVLPTHLVTAPLSTLLRILSIFHSLHTSADDWLLLQRLKEMTRP